MSKYDDIIMQAEEKSAAARLARARADIKLRDGAALEERRTEREWRRQSLALQAEKAIVMLGQLTVAELTTYATRLGLDLMKDTQDLMGEARETLDSEYLAKFRVFSDRVLREGASGIVELQVLGDEAVMDIIVTSVNFRELPEEKQSIITRIARFLKGR